MENIKIYNGSELVDMGVYKDSNGNLIGNVFIYESNQSFGYVKRIDIEKLKDRLEKIEIQLSKCRTSVIEDGWQTQKFAKKSRKWDYYAQEKMAILKQIDLYEEKINAKNI